MVVDRNEPQMKAIQEVYPETIIVFCLIHIRKNLLTHFNNESDIIHLFDEMQYDLSLCDEFIATLESFIQDNPKSEAVNSLELLLSTREYWMPSILIEKGVYIGFNNNRSESFFGSFKQRYGFTLRTATVLIKQLQSNASLELSSSIESFQKTTTDYGDIFPFLFNKDINYLGEFALSRISDEN